MEEDEKHLFDSDAFDDQLKSYFEEMEDLHILKDHASELFECCEAMKKAFDPRSDNTFVCKQEKYAIGLLRDVLEKIKLAHED